MTARRYEPLLRIASGGTAAVHVGTASGALGFKQLVAIKIPHAHLADDPAFRAALLDEARIAARLHHANVVDVRDVEADDGGIQLVMDYVEGASLSEMIRGWTKEPPQVRPEAVAIRIVLDACEGLRALHELKGDDGAPLGLVHRDVSPANILVGLDGAARLADFGLAKSLLAVEKTTSEGTLRGKLGYMAPEYVRGKAIDQRLDVFAMGVVLWEAIARRRLFRGESDGETLDKVQRLEAPSLAETSAQLDEPARVALDALIARAVAKDRDARIPSVAALAAELEAAARAHDLTATPADVRDAFAPSLHATLDERRRAVQQAMARAPSPSASVPVTASPSVTATAPSTVASPSAVASAAPSPVRARLPLVLGLAFLVLGGLAAAASFAARSRAPGLPALPSASAAAASASIEPSASASASAPASASASPSASSPRRPHPADPGAKPPRPNPYAPR